MTDKLFEAALGVSTPWYVAGTEFDAQAKVLTIRVDFTAGSRLALTGVDGQHPVRDTVPKRCRHLNFFQHECFPEILVPRVKPPDDSVRQVDSPWDYGCPDPLRQIRHVAGVHQGMCPTAK